jgi:hypothetical protein
LKSKPAFLACDDLGLWQLQLRRYLLLKLVFRGHCQCGCEKTATIELVTILSSN